MANVLNTLYPPQVSTFMNAFVNTENAKVYYSLSPYNSSTDIKRVHISVTNQLNNENALNLETGIIISEGLEYDTKRGLYVVEIPTSALSSGSFNINQFYKVQLRFDSYDGDQSHSTEKEKTAYLLDNQNYFSEWSSVCLIRPILQPSIVLRQFDSWTGDTAIAFNKGIIPISGKMFFGEDTNNESETLQSYQIKVAAKDDEDEILLTSPTVYTGDNLDPNDINYKLNVQSLDTSDAIEFVITITATTKNQYVLSKTYEFQIADYYTDENFTPTISATADDNRGNVAITITNVKSVFGTYYVKRASSLSGFTDWEDIYSSKVSGSINLTLTDNTVGSLLWYRYSVQLENSKGALSRVYTSGTVMPDFYDVFLSAGDKQISLRYDYKISSFKPVVNRNKIDTLGGKYPKFAENAILNYKQFSVTATLSAEIDPYQQFLSKSSVYTTSKGTKNLRTNYVADHDNIKEQVRNDLSDYDISGDTYYPSDQFPTDTTKRFITTTTNDWMWEREFRDNLVEWLNNGEPKLYRSMAEGNMVVMLTDVSLTPKSQLGRRIWDISATAYECADATSLETLDTLGIYNRTLIDDTVDGHSQDGDDDEYVEVIKVGQLYNYTPPEERTNLISVLLQDLKEKYGGVLVDKKPDDLYLKNIKIFYQSKANIFLPNGNNFDYVNDPSVYTAAERSRMVMGYTFSLQTSGSTEKLFFVNERGYYQVPNNLDVIGLYFNQTSDVVTIEYTMVYKERNDSSTTVSGSTVERIVVGQEQAVFQPDDYQGERIRNKYNFVRPTDNGKETDFYEKMQYWKGICLDVTPFALAHIQYEGDDDFHDYLVGKTGVLHMLKNMPVKDICFKGRRMRKVDYSRKRFLKEWEYVLDPTAGLTSTSEVKKPIENAVYLIGNKKKIYYHSAWYDFEEEGSEILSFDHRETEALLMMREFGDDHQEAEAVLNMSTLGEEVISSSNYYMAELGESDPNASLLMMREFGDASEPTYFPRPGSTKYLYLESSTGILYSWNGSDYEEYISVETDGLAKVPVEGAINYYGNIVKSVL